MVVVVVVVVVAAASAAAVLCSLGFSSGFWRSLFLELLGLGVYSFMASGLGFKRYGV